MNALRAKLASSARWTLSIRAIERAIGFVSTLILARLLSPVDFGVVAMGTAIHTILTSLTSFGFTQAIIRMRRAPADAYSTAFTLNVITGLAVALVLVASILPAARWYDDARVVPVLLVLALASFLGGFRNTGLTRYERALNFRPFFTLALVRKLASFGTGAVCAVIWHNYWALLAGILVGTVAEVAVSFRLTRFRPRFTLARLRELMQFSLWWLACQAMGTFGSRAQDLMVGQQMGASMLGKYSVALDLATMPTAEIVGPVMRAVYPGYVQMKDESGRLLSAFTRVWGAVALLAIPSAVGVACVADLMTRVVLGPKWAAAAPLMGLLAIIGALQAMSTCYWPMLLTRLGPKTVFVLSLIGSLLALPAFGIALTYRGIEWAIGAWIAASVVMLFVSAKILTRDLGGPAWPLLSELIRPAIAAAIMAAVLAGLEAWLLASTRPLSDVALLLVLVATGVTVYTASVALLWWLAGRPRGSETDLLYVALSRLR